MIAFVSESTGLVIICWDFGAMLYNTTADGPIL